MFQGNIRSFQNQDYFWREITAWLRRRKKVRPTSQSFHTPSQEKKLELRHTWAIFWWHLPGKSRTVVHGWLGRSTTQPCKGLSKGERDTHCTATNPHCVLWLSPNSKEVHLSPSLLRPPHRIYSLGFQGDSALSSCPWGTNLTGATRYGAFLKIHLDTWMVIRLFWKI